MLGKGLAYPGVFPVFGIDDHNQVVPRSIVGMEQVGEETEETQATGDDDKLIFFTEFLEQFLLVYLSKGLVRLILIH